MDRTEARRKYLALQRLTVERGATPAEADTAKQLAAKLFKLYHRGGDKWQDEEPTRPAYTRQQSWYTDFNSAVRKFHWEYRRCGKRNCWCSQLIGGHGPYRYEKRRVNKVPHSIYRGK